MEYNASLILLVKLYIMDQDTKFKANKTSKQHIPYEMIVQEAGNAKTTERISDPHGYIFDL